MSELLKNLTKLTPEEIQGYASRQGNSFQQGLRSGTASAKGTAQAFAGGVAEAAGATDFAANRYADSRRLQDDAQRYAPEISDYKQVLDAPDLGTGIRRAGSYVAGLAGQSLPYVAVGLGAGAATLATGGGVLPAMGAATLASLPFHAGEAIQTQQDDPISMQRSAGERLATASGVGVVNSALDNVIPMAMGAKMIGRGVKQGIRGGARSGVAATIGKNVLGGMAGGGFTEGGQEFVQQQGHALTNPNRDTTNDRSNIISNAVGGAAMGGLMGGMGGVGQVVHRPGFVSETRDKIAGGINKVADRIDGVKSTTAPARAKIGAFADSAWEATSDATGAAAAKVKARMPEFSAALDQTTEFMKTEATARKAQTAAWYEEMKKDTSLPAHTMRAMDHAYRTIDEAASQAKIAAIRFAKEHAPLAKSVAGGMANTAKDLASTAKQSLDDFITERRRAAPDVAEATLYANGVDVPATRATNAEELKREVGFAAKKLAKWADSIMADPSTTEEQRAAITALNGDYTSTDAAMVVGKAFKDKIARYKAVQSVNALYSRTRDRLSKPAGNTKRSEFNPAMQQAIAESVMPFLEKHNPVLLQDNESISKLGGILRNILTDAQRGKVNKDDVADLQVIFGGAVSRVLMDVYRASKLDNEPAIKAIRAIAEREDTDRTRIQLLESQIPAEMVQELGYDGLLRLSEFIEAHVDESAYVRMSKDERFMAQRAFKQDLAQLLGENAEKIEAAYAAKTKTLKTSNMADRADEETGMTEEEKADDLLRDGEMSEDNPNSGMSERDIEDESAERVYYGKGDKDDPELVMSEDSHRAMYNNESPAERLINNAAGRHSMANFVPVEELGDYHPAVVKAREEIAAKTKTARAKHDASYERDVAARADALYRDMLDKAEKTVNGGKAISDKRMAELRDEAETVARNMVPKTAFEPTPDLDLDNYGLVVGEGTRQESGMTSEMYKSMRAITDKEKTGPSRLNVNQKYGAIEVSKLVRSMLGRDFRLNKDRMAATATPESSNERLMRAFTEGISAVAEFTGVVPTDGRGKTDKDGRPMYSDDIVLQYRKNGKHVTLGSLREAIAKDRYHYNDAEWMKGLSDEEINTHLRKEELFAEVTRAELIRDYITPLTNRIEAAVQAEIDAAKAAGVIPTRENVAATWKRAAASPIGQSLALAESAYYRADKRSKGNSVLDTDGVVDGGIYDMGKLAKREALGQANDAQRTRGASMNRAYEGDRQDSIERSLFGSGKGKTTQPESTFALRAQEKMLEAANFGAERQPTTGERIRAGRRYLSHLEEKIEALAVSDIESKLLADREALSATPARRAEGESREDSQPRIREITKDVQGKTARIDAQLAKIPVVKEREALRAKANRANAALRKLEAQEAREMKPDQGTGRTDITPDTDVVSASAAFGERGMGARLAASRGMDPANAQKDKGKPQNDPGGDYERFTAKMERLRKVETPQAKTLVDRIDLLDAFASVRKDGELVMKKEDRTVLHSIVITQNKVSAIMPQINRLYAKYGRGGESAALGLRGDASQWGEGPKKDKAVGNGASGLNGAGKKYSLMSNSPLAEKVSSGLEGIMRDLGFKVADPRFANVAEKLLTNPNIDPDAFARESAEALSYLVMQGEPGQAIRAALQSDVWLPARAKLAGNLVSQGWDRGTALVESYRLLAQRAIAGELKAQTAAEKSLVQQLKKFVRSLIRNFKEATESEKFAAVVRDALNQSVENARGGVKLKPGHKKVSFQEAVDADPQAARVLAHMSTHKDVSITGSIVLAHTGRIYRNAQNMLHDLDFIVQGTKAAAEAHLKKMFPDAVQIYSFSTQKNQVDTFLVPPDGANIVNIVRKGMKVVGFEVERDGEIIGRTWNDADGEHKSGEAGTFVDFFTGTVARPASTIQFTVGGKAHSVFASPPASIFDAKLQMGRDKDLNDYAAYVSNTGTKFSKQDTAGSSIVTPAQKQEVRDYIEKILGPKVNVLFKNIMHAGDYDSTIDLIQLATRSYDPMGTAFHEAMHAFLKQLRDYDMTGANEVLFKAASTPHVMKQLRKLLENEPEARKQIESDIEERAAYMFQFSRTLGADGKPLLVVGPGAKTVIGRIVELLRQITGLMSDSGRAAHIMDMLHSGEYQRARAGGGRSAVARVIQDHGTNKTFEALKKTLAPLSRISANILSSGDARMRAFAVPALTKIANSFVSRTTDASTGDPGFIAAQGMQYRQIMNSLVERIGPAKEEHLEQALEMLQSGVTAPDPEARLIARTVKESLQETLAYMEAAGIEVKSLGPDYFPVVWDISFISQNRDAFAAMLQPYIDSGEFKGTADGLIQHFMTSAGNEFGVETITPGMQHLRKRVLDFIKPEDRAPFLQKNMFSALHSYVQQATRRAEWTRRFGEDSKGLVDLLQEAKREGATDKQLEYAQNFIKGVDGTLGDDIDPDIRRLFGNMIVYQNVRLLPMAVFTMAVDPMGTLVRGGTLSDAFNSFKRGIKEIPRGFKDLPKDEWYELGELMGVIDNTALVRSLGSSYAQGMVGDTGRKINDTLFKYNLVEQMNTSMRVAAIPAALKFMAKHADGTHSAHSKRWLAELDFKPGEMVVKDGKPLLTYDQFSAHGMSPDAAASAAVKMRGALNKWVDGAVLRPNAAMKPVWMNDPHWALIAHLKQFVYAFNETILKRVLNEARHGNYSAAYAVASYVPMMIAADALKGAILTGGDEPEFKEGWGLLDYVGHGIERAGLTGVGQFGLDAVQDIKYGGVGLGVLGPTIEQLADGMQMVGGQGSFSGFLKDSAPASVLVKSGLSGLDEKTRVLER